MRVLLAGAARRRRRALLACAVLLLAACGGGDRSPTSPGGGEAVFLLRACAGSGAGGETFRILTRDPAVIQEATALIGRGPGRRLVRGALRAGDGGFNAPWRWHLAPADVRFADLAVEVCDGCPHDIEGDLGYWLGNVGSYCPWSTEVLARER